MAGSIAVEPVAAEAYPTGVFSGANAVLPGVDTAVGLAADVGPTGDSPPQADTNSSIKPATTPAANRCPEVRLPRINNRVNDLHRQTGSGLAVCSISISWSQRQQI